jgi:hypothetical protein
MKPLILALCVIVGMGCASSSRYNLRPYDKSSYWRQTITTSTLGCVKRETLNAPNVSACYTFPPGTTIAVMDYTEDEDVWYYRVRDVANPTVLLWIRPRP